MKKLMKFQLKDLLLSYSVYALVMLLLTVVVSYISAVHDNTNISINGSGLSGAIFCFVIGIAMYKEHCQMAVQNSISRKDFFYSSICVTIIICFLCALLDVLLLCISQFACAIAPDNYNFNGIGSLMLLFYPGFLARSSTSAVWAAGFLLTFLMCMVLSTTGILIAGIYCRLPKKFRTAYCIGVPVFFCGFGLFPLLTLAELILPGTMQKLLDFLSIVMGISSENPFLGMLTFAFGAVVIGWVCYRILRKTDFVS